jgi:mono/diheme cytochrome c family protein
MIRRLRTRAARAVAWLGLAAALVVVAAWLATVVFGPVHITPRAHAAGGSDSVAIARGEYLARMGNCITCHSTPGGKPFAGGLPMATPIGTVYTTNITPDSTGIGDYDLADFDRAVRHGIRKGNDSEYPAMPFPSYAGITDADLTDLYAYFMHGVAPVSQPNRPSTIPWPLSMRWPLTWWRWLFAPNVSPFMAPAGTSLEVARGAYLVETLGHCGACHTPRALTMQEKGLTPEQGPNYLAGSDEPVDGWIATSLRRDSIDGLRGWNHEDLVQLLKTGRNAHGTVFGNMSDVITNSTQYLTPTDLSAIAAFIEALPVTRETVPSATPMVATSTAGAGVYTSYCASCHGAGGEGVTGVFPPLAHNPVLESPNPASLVHVVLAGSTPALTQQATPGMAMPGYGAQLTDQQVADVTNYVRSRWAHGGKTTHADVAGMRKDLQENP